MWREDSLFPFGHAKTESVAQACRFSLFLSCTEIHLHIIDYSVSWRSSLWHTSLQIGRYSHGLTTLRTPKILLLLSRCGCCTDMQPLSHLQQHKCRR